MAMVRRLAVTLLRHGLTEENKQKQYIGYCDPPLCEEGRIELYRLHRNKGYPEPGAILASDRMRCVETAEVLFPESKVQISPALREMHFGEWERKTYGDLCGIQRYRDWIDDPIGVCPPGGESYQDFENRVRGAWHREIWPSAEESGHVIVVTHGGPIRYLLSEFAPERREMWAWPVSHGKGYTLYWNETKGRLKKRCTLLQEAPFTEKPNGCSSTILPQG
ncbi:histidine phosphatase family protein [Fictibacillus sp. WQ 8-8]|uniref:histidine phosphatase family protein n=1 Tax=Fictibacillus sp. WQ 8-8 TaxID=2938788 RepID=UPI00210F1FC9|nr:histidine phosphatase family protein [Fictibacillus sp. WQ 8-8]MCQ6264265.1 histidine phosphatase family protein [Fictibacillus sp. WQ 8-8]